MRKYLCVLMSIILCLTVFCACSNGKTANVAESTNITSSTSSEQTTDTEEVTVTANEVQTTQKKDKKTNKIIVNSYGGRTKQCEKRIRPLILSPQSTR